MRTLSRVAAGAAIVLSISAAIVALAAPASAHSVGGAQPTNYKSEIFSVSPAAPGLRLRLLELGRKVALTNTSSTDVVVIGYHEEPYLKVGPSGAFENRRSPTVYRNRASNPSQDAEVPPEADAAAAPEWTKTSGANRIEWRDQRTRWEGPQPAEVRAAPGTPRVLSQWTIPMRHGDQQVVATGVITWIPGPSAVPWLLLALGLFVLTVALAWGLRWGARLAIALAVLVAVDIVYSFGSAAADEDAIVVMVLKVLGLGFISTLAWIGAVWAVGRLQNNDEIGLLVAAMAAFVIALYGVSDTGSLGRSQLAYALPDITARAAVAITLGIGFGLVVAAIVVFKRNPGLVSRANDSP